MILLTSVLRDRLIANGREPNIDHVPVVKINNPIGAGSDWLLNWMPTVILCLEWRISANCPHFLGRNRVVISTYATDRTIRR